MALLKDLYGCNEDFPVGGLSSSSLPGILKGSATVDNMVSELKARDSFP